MGGGYSDKDSKILVFRPLNVILLKYPAYSYCLSFVIPPQCFHTHIYPLT